MVVYFGMSEKLPNLNYYDSSGQDWGFTKPYSEETSRMIDQEVQRIITEQYERAKKILSDHAEGHNKLAQVLLEREVIYTEDVEHIFGKRAWISRSQEILDLQEKANNDKQVAAEETKTDETTPQSRDYKVRAVPAGTNETDNIA